VGGAANRDTDLELVVFSADDVRTFALPPEGDVTIGRGETNTIRIDDPAVSRNHAVLHVGAGLKIQDLGSANGTVVRSKGGAVAPGGDTMNVRQLFQREAMFAVGDSLLFGTTCVVVRHRPAAGAAGPTAAKPGAIVRDPAMRQLYEQVTLVARATISVLILGETGVGKEVLARALHAQSRRAEGPFLGINCATLTESLQESELFGFEKGAFTGAHQARAGLFESAQGGTVFLDEVGELSAGAQAKLLRVLEQRTVTRLGSTRERPVDVRFVAATNRDIETDIAAGRFRNDLFFRLNGVSLLIPPLRERPDEIEPLARSFLAAAALEVERDEPPSLSTATLEILRAYRWPGNVRELRNAIERAVILSPGEVILPEHLPPALLRVVEAQRTTVLAPPANGWTAGDQGEPPEPPERRRILEALERSAGNQTRAARLLGISRGTLISRLNEHGLPRPRKREDAREE
jgi:DNA-binding NtrC family response regulator